MMLNDKEQYIADIIERKGPHFVVKLGDTWTSTSFMIVEGVESGNFIGTVIKQSEIGQSDVIANMSVLISCYDISTMTASHRQMIREVLVERFYR